MGRESDRVWRPLPLPLLLSAVLALASSAWAAEPSSGEETCPPGDEECCADPSRPGCRAATEPEAKAGDVRAGAPGPEATLGAARIAVRPAKVRPGDLFEIAVDGEHLRSAAGSFAGRPVSLFASGPSSFRGYGAVPLDYPAGPVLVHVAVVDEQMLASSTSVTLLLDERAVLKKTITVSRKFTSPSAAQVRQAKEDGKAIAESYRVPFGPPLFRENFADPLGGERGSRFGEKRVFNGKTKSRHWGVDIDGERGAPVHAANDGVVVLARRCFTSGWTVLVSHGAGLFTGYFHFSKFAVATGDKVTKGQVLGYVGSTGRSTGPHLHFAARLGSGLIDPEALLDFDFASGLSPPPAASPTIPQQARDGAAEGVAR